MTKTDARGHRTGTYDEGYADGHDDGRTEGYGEGLAETEIAVLSRLKPGEILPGGKLMVAPVEPTQAMWRAFNKVVPANPKKEWAAMLAAAKEG